MKICRVRDALGLVLVFICCVFLQACSGHPDREEELHKLKVVATLFPLWDFARNVGGERADVSLLLPPGVEPHSFEPKPGDVLKIEAADLFIYTGRYMEPWAESLLKGFNRDKLIAVNTSAAVPESDEDARSASVQTRQRDASGVHQHADVDPHIWLDLGYAQMMVDAILAGFVAKDPAHKAFYTRNAEAYKARLAELDEEFRRGLATCKKRVIIHGGHFAFNYLAKRYNLTYVSAYSGSPDSEPTAKKLMELERMLKKYDVRYIYFEELITPRVAEIISQETGASLLKLHGAHNVTRDELNHGVTFIGIMKQNLENLKIGLECQ